MFKKKPTIKHLTPLRSTDRRKLANQIIKDYNLPAPAPPETEATLRNSILPENARSARITTTAGPDLATVSGTVYFGGPQQQRPLWVKMGSDPIFPTVYTLWQTPSLVPLLATHAPVMERLRDGADLMIPGLAGSPPFPDGAKRGSIVAVASTERPGVPLVVGVCEVDVCALGEVAGGKGKAVRVLHWVGDEIFKIGGGGAVPTVVGGGGDGGERVEEEEEEEEDEGGVGLGDGEGNEEKEEGGAVEEDKEEGKEEIRELSTNEIDNTFRSAAIFGLHDYSSTERTASLDFPLTSSQFISTLVLPYLPPASNFPPYNLLQKTSPHPSLQLKKSSFKNAAKFLKALDKEALIKIKNRNGGEVVVLDVDWEKNTVKRFTPYQLPEPPKEAKKEAGGGPSNGTPQGSVNMLKVIELFRPTGKLAVFFQVAGAGTKDYYTVSSVKSIMTTYLEKESLINQSNKRLAKIDPNIASALLKDSDPEDAAALRSGYVKRERLSDKLVHSCSPYYRVVKAGADDDNQATKPTAGPPPRVSIILETRQGKKTVTRISGLEPFSIDAKAAAEYLQKACAGSASVAQLHGSSPKTPVMEITLQGSQSKAVEAYLEKKGVAARFVSVVDKTTGSKKKMK